MTREALNIMKHVTINYRIDLGPENSPTAWHSLDQVWAANKVVLRLACATHLYLR